MPAGRVVTQPCRERKVAGAVTSSSELASARTAATSSARSSSLAGVDGQVQAEAEQLALAAGQPVRQVARVSAAASVSGSSSWPRSAPARRPDSSRARWRRSRSAAAAGGTGSMCRATSRRPGVRQQRLQPPGGDLGRVAGDGEGGGVVVTDPQVPGGDLDVRRPGHWVRGGVVRGAAGRGGAGCGSGSWQGPRAGDGLAGNSEPGGVDGGAGVGGGGEQGGDLPAVQRADGQVCCGQQPGGLGGALRGAQPAAAAPRAAPGPARRGSRVTRSTWRVSRSRPAARSVEERGVVEGGGLQGRVGEGGGGVFQVGDRGGQVGVRRPG